MSVELVKGLVLDQVSNLRSNPTTYSGLLLLGFMLTHGVGNLHALQGRKSYNSYAYKLQSVPGFTLVEVALGGLFLGHAAGGGATFLKTLQTAAKTEGGILGAAGRELLERPTTSFLSGAAILGFLVKHIQDFRLGGESGPPEDQPRDKLGPEWRWPHLQHSKEIPEVEVKDIYELAVRRMKRARGLALYAGALYLFWVHVRAALRPAVTMRVGIPLAYNKQFLQLLRAVGGVSLAGFAASLAKLKLSG
jgi:hypothetical protein